MTDAFASITPKPYSPTRPPPLSLPINRTPSSFLSTRALLSTVTPSGGPTPSMLTPNTRSEAEAAFAANSALQTDAAAPTTPVLPNPPANAAAGEWGWGRRAASGVMASAPGGVDGLPEADEGGRRQSLGTRPAMPTRSSSNYLKALGEAGVNGTGPAGSGGDDGDAGDASPAAAKAEGAGIGGQVDGEAVSGSAAPAGVGWRPAVGRQQSWSEQDMRRLMQQKLMGKTAEGDMGYDSATDEIIG